MTTVEQHKEGELWIFPKQKDFLKENSNSIRAIVGNATAGADAEMINSLPKLEIISSYSVGLDKIDLARCKEKGIRVTTTPDVLTEDVADLAIGLILATLRGKMRNKVKLSTGLDTFTLMEQKIGEKLVSFMENDYGGRLISLLFDRSDIKILGNQISISSMTTEISITNGAQKKSSKKLENKTHTKRQPQLQAQQ
ncbi:hypothetical protein HHK36_006788 [Tetracentron sinense]|uniref:D-isomer specific 2-hydroxyacid dehydrogenase catalytic domain-containing protein n=1 Tax=Tetracentron sinense TaxID=13715 RepID=A0A834ZL77_TETSI|nr:hypothetical protein HHK36_006788 [Tetracentron sinense]